MIITPGYWRTKLNMKARVLIVDGPGERPVVGYIDNGTWSMPHSWPLSGDSSINSLIAPWEEESCNHGQPMNFPEGSVYCIEHGLCLREKPESKEEEPAHEHEYTDWVIVPGQLEVRQCRVCGNNESRERKPEPKKVKRWLWAKSGLSNWKVITNNGDPVLLSANEAEQLLYGCVKIPGTEIEVDE